MLKGSAVSMTRPSTPSLAAVKASRPLSMLELKLSMAAMRGSPPSMSAGVLLVAALR